MQRVVRRLATRFGERRAGQRRGDDALLGRAKHERPLEHLGDPGLRHDDDPAFVADAEITGRDSHPERRMDDLRASRTQS